MRLRPPFPWYGGKQKMAAKIVPLLPPHTVYVEPFAGGAAVYWEKGMSKAGNAAEGIEVLNDTNDMIISFYRCLTSRSLLRGFLEKIRYMPYSNMLYQSARKSRGRTTVQRAVDFYFAISAAFANKGVNAGFGFSVRNANEAASWHTRKTALMELADQYHARMSRTIVESVDCIKCIERYDSPTTLFYCDPPYIDTNQGQYSGYTRDDYARLLTTLAACQGSVVLSGYPNDMVPADWPYVDFETKMSAARDKTIANARIERLWILDRTSVIMNHDHAGQLYIT